MKTEFMLYVGTYAKYTSGSIKGEWMDLTKYEDKKEFLQACAELHSDEEDPEFMFQDYEGLPEFLYNESYVSPFIWVLIEYLGKRNFDEATEKIFLEFISDFDTSRAFDNMDIKDFENFLEREGLDTITLASDVDIEYQYFKDKGFTDNEIDKFSSFVDTEHVLKSMDLEGYKFKETDQYSDGQFSRRLYACLFFVET